EPTGVDAIALFAKNNASLIFAEGDNIAVLTSYDSFSGIGNTKSEESQTVNGQGYSISAESKREGSHCSIFLYGQKVYETYIAKSFSVGSQYMPGKVAKAASALPQVRSLGSSGAYEVTQSGVFDLISASLKPSKEALDLLEKKLALSDEQVNSLFKLSAYGYAESAVRIANESSAIWSDAHAGNLIGHESILKNIFDGTHRNLALEIRLAVPSFSYGEAKNDADNGNLKLILQIALAKQGNGLAYETQSLQNNGLFPFNEKESVQCAKDRASAFIGGSSTSNTLRPSVDQMIHVCETLHQDALVASYNSGLMKSLIPQIFYGIIPSGQIQYGGWDQVLSKLSLDLLKQGSDIRTELDPSDSTKIVRIVADHLLDLKAEVDNSKNLPVLEDAIYQMGLRWAFLGQNVSSSRVSQILQAVDNTADTFQVSSELLLRALSSQPNSFDDSLSFALSIDANYKSEALKALNRAKDLNYADFENDVFNQVIQKKLSFDEFKDWNKKFSVIKTELDKHSDISTVRGDLVGLSLKWLKSGEASPQDLSTIYAALNNSINPFSESTKTLLQDLSQSLGANKEALDFARNLTPEYKRVALAIRENATLCEFESWGSSFFQSILQKRPSMDQLNAWNELWTSSLAFIQREKGRTSGQMAASPEWNRKKVLELAVRETWGQQEFSAFEAIANVAKGKNTCERYIDASSLADCAGMDLFSKGTKKFFDPSFGNRYATLSADFSNYMNLLSGSDMTTLRWNLNNAFFGTWEPIWSHCDLNLFNTKAANLKSQVSAYVTTSDTMKKWELERQIRDTIENCQ
ncbi:MAG: hypothetical protein ACXVB1_15715, partial [Pseudobdellovibrionaceae bacterium]